MIIFIEFKFGKIKNGKGKTWTEFRLQGWRKAWTTNENPMLTARRSTPTSSNINLHFLEGPMPVKERLSRLTISMIPGDCLPLPLRKMAGAGTIIASGTKDHYPTIGKRVDAAFATTRLSTGMIVHTATDVSHMSSGIA